MKVDEEVLDVLNQAKNRGGEIKSVDFNGKTLFSCSCGWNSGSLHPQEAENKAVIHAILEHGVVPNID